MSRLERRLDPEGLPPEEFEQRRLERQRARRRRRLLRGLAAGAAALLAAGLFVALRVNFTWIVTRRARQTGPALAARPQPPPWAGTGLAVSEAHIQADAGHRRIVGTIHNPSPRACRDVEVSLLVRSLAGAAVGYVRARVALVPPSADATFATGALPPGGDRFELFALAGNPAP